VLVCDGNFAVNSVPINKAVTVTAEGPGIPTLDAGSNARAFVISNASGGVALSHLRLSGGTAGLVLVAGNTASVSLRHNEFRPTQTRPFGQAPVGNIAAVSVVGTGNASVLVDSNAFVGGDVGLSISFIPTVEARVGGNIFSGQVSYALVIAANGVMASGSVTGNSFEDCGLFACASVGQPITLTNNTFTARVSRRSTAMLQVSIPTTLTTQPAIISDNTFTGLDIDSGPRAFASTYTVNNAILISNGSAVVTGNAIVRVFFGISAATAAGTVATDNVITTTASPFANQTSTPGITALTAKWNDVSDYVDAVGNIAGLDLGALNIRCNWWGQAAGPTSIQPSIPPSTYTPVAIAPIAGGNHGACVP
jgi:hypothetical protein